MKEFLKFNNAKLLILVSLLVMSLILGLMADRSSDPFLSFYLFFPLQLERFFDGLFRTTIQDFRTCLFPGCDLVVTLLTIAVSFLIYYLLASMIYYLWKDRRGLKNKK